MAKKNENDNVVGFDISQAEAAITKLNSLLGNYNNILEVITRSQATFNSQGEATGVVLNTLDTQGRSLTRVIKDLGDGFQVVSTAIRDSKDATAELNTQIKEAARTGSLLDWMFRRDKAGRYQRTTGGFASKAELDNARALEQATLDELLDAHTTHQNTLRDQEREFQSEILAARLKTAASEEEQLAELLQAHESYQGSLREAEYKLQAEILAARLRTQESEESRLAEVQRIQEEYNNRQAESENKLQAELLSSRLKASEAEQSRLSELQRIREEYEERQRTEESQLQSELMVSRLKTDASERERLAEIERIREEYNSRQLDNERRLQAELLVSRLRAAQAEQERLAQQARNTAASSFGQNRVGPINFTGASSGQVQGVTSAVAQMTTLIRDGSVSATRATEILMAVIARLPEVYEGAEARIAAAASRFVEATDKLPAYANNAMQRAAAAAGSAQKNFSAAMSLLNKSSNDAATRLYITWDAVFRFVQFRFVYTAIFSFINALREASREARQFEIAISEIRTISQTAQLSTEQWGNEVRKLSDQYGLASKDVTEAVYQTVSNQIAKGREASQFVGQASKFAATAVSSVEDAVNLLSSAINAFGFQTQDTERIAAVFFRTIEVGRVRASEMANTFGRVAQLSHSLGVTFEEVNAAIATLTIQGIRYNEAFTLINNLMVGLVKPTKEMKELFKEWGVANGETAVRTFGYVGVLRKLQEATHGSSTETAELFHNVRQIRAVLGQTGDAFGLYEKSLRAVSEEALPAYRRATEIAFESSGKKAEIELNKIKNFFLFDFGLAFNKALTGEGGNFSSFTGILSNMIKLLGGGQGLSAALQNLIKIITYLIKGFIAYKVVQIAVNANTAISIQLWKIQQIGLLQNNEALQNMTRRMLAQQMVLYSLRKVMAAVFSPQGLLTIGLAAFFWYQQRQAEIQKEIEQSFEHAADVRIAAMEKENEAFRSNYEDQLQIVRDQLNKQFEVRLTHIATLRAAVSKALEAEKTSLKEAGKSIKDLLDVDTKEAQDALNAISKAYDQTVDSIKKSSDKISALKEDLTDKQFQAKLKALSPADQVKALTDHVAELAASGTDLLAQAPDRPAAFEESQKKYTKAEEAILKLQEEQNKLLEKRKELTDQLAEVGRKAVSNDKVQEQQQNLTNLRELEAAYVRSKAKHPRGDPSILAQITEARKKLEETRDANQDANSAARGDKIQKELDLINGQLAAFPKSIDYEKQILELHNQQVQALETYQKIQESIAETEKSRLESERQRFESLKTAFQEIAKFELPKEGVTTEAGKKTALTTYDELIAKAQSYGLTDQATLFELQKYRVKIAKQADLEIANHTLETQADALTKQRQQIDKFQEDIKAGRIKTQEGFKSQFEQLYNVVAGLAKVAESRGQGPNASRLRSVGIPDREATLQEAIQGYVDIPASRWGGAARQADVGSGQQIAVAVREMQQALQYIEILKNGPERITELTKQLEDVRAQLAKTPTENLRKREQELLQGVSGTQAILASTSLPQEMKRFNDALSLYNQRIGKEGASLTQPGAEGIDIGGGKTVATAVSEATQSLLNIQTVFNQQADVLKAETTLREQLQQLGVDTTALATKRAETEKALNRYGDAFVNQIKATAESMKKLEDSVRATEAQIRVLLGTPPAAPVAKSRGGSIFAPQGTDTVPAMLTPGEYVVNAIAARKHFAELQAINYFNKGGSVLAPTFHQTPTPMMIATTSSTDVGGVHITMVQSGNAETDAKALGHQINRGIRNGTIKFRRA